MRACLLLVAVACAGCLRFGYDHTHAEEPIPPVESLQRGTDDLASCLRRFGAPHFVWEYQGDGMALAWYSSDSSGWDFDVSYSFGRAFTSASFSLDWDDLDLPGLVLWFDPGLKLLEWKQGPIGQLTSGLRQRPAPVDDGQ